LSYIGQEQRESELGTVGAAFKFKQMGSDEVRVAGCGECGPIMAKEVRPVHCVLEAQKNPITR
jgi:hypothetical protein